MGQLRAGTWLWVMPSCRVSPSFSRCSLALRACAPLSVWRGIWSLARGDRCHRGTRFNTDVAEPPCATEPAGPARCLPTGRAAPAPAQRSGLAVHWDHPGPAVPLDFGQLGHRQEAQAVPLGTAGHPRRLQEGGRPWDTSCPRVCTPHTVRGVYMYTRGSTDYDRPSRSDAKEPRPCRRITLQDASSDIFCWCQK